MSMIQANYTDIQRVLTDERALADAAEAHGTLAGSLCAGGYRFEDWLLEILPEGRAQPLAAATLREVYSETAGSLRAPDMEFDLLLPEEAQSIDARASALAQWCQGFLYGLGSGAVQDAASLPGDVGEIVRDLTEISRVGVDIAQTEESNENAYAELVEFVRVSVQVVFEELEPLRAQPSSPGASLH
ncbi:MAG TPA: UPF0149 family protein [Steroidobacteraceae bacterium]|nr:UPF0149 family protein [Steroidobacteraceae bacterium]